MNAYIQNAIKNLLPLSESTDFSIAMTEWQTNGTIVDYLEGADEGDFDDRTNLPACELCDHPELRYHFGITNKLNGNELLVGSRCILRFEGIGVVDASTGQVFTGDERRKALQREKDRLIRRQKKAKRKKEEDARRKVELESTLARLQAAEQRREQNRREQLSRLRNLYRKATKSRSFIVSVANRIKAGIPLTPRQQQAMNGLLDKFEV